MGSRPPKRACNNELSSESKKTKQEEEKLVSFSKWTSEMFKEKFGITFNPRNMGRIQFGHENFSKKEISFIIDSFKKIVITRGGVTNINEREATFSHYPDIIITSALYEFSQENTSGAKVFISDQYSYGEEKSKGLVDLVLCMNNTNEKEDKEDIILFVTEVKTPLNTAQWTITKLYGTS